MEACRIVTSLFGSDAIFAPRANTGRKNNGRPHGPLFKNLHRSVFSHNNQPNHFPHSFIGPAHLRTLPPQLYVRKVSRKENVCQFLNTLWNKKIVFSLMNNF